jgi:hypothetical protein
MILVLVLAGVLVLMALVGWARFEWSENRATLTIETGAIREKTAGLMFRGRELLARFGGRRSSHGSASHAETRASEAGPGPSTAGHHP